MARTNPLSAAFWADAPAEAPGSYASLESRRRIAEQLTGKKSPFPKTLGEGLTYFGESLVDRARLNELSDAEHASDTYADKRLNDIRNTPGGYVPPAEGTATAPAEGTATAPAARDAYAQTDSALAVPLPQRRPVGGEDGDLAVPLPQRYPVGGAAPPIPNNLLAQLQTPPQRNQPGAPSTWSSGTLQQVPTNLAGVAPGTFGMRDPAAPATVSVGRGDEMTVGGQPAAAPMMPNAGLPFLTNEQRNRIAALISSQPRPFEQAPDAAPALETPEAATAGQDGPLLADRETDADVRTSPIRLASLGDVPPPNTATAAANNPPIATDIKPMPQQVAENSPGVPPSRLPIPPDVPQEMKHPGPEPVQPRPLGPSSVQQKMETIFNDRRLDPTVREAAKQRYLAEEGYRKELEAARSNKYTNDRAQWNQDVRAYDKFVREANDRDIDRRIKLQGVEKTNADLEKMYFERGMPRQQAVEKARLDIIRATQETVEPKVIEGPGGQRYERAPGSPVGAPFTELAGIPKSEKLTEEQAKALRYWQRGYVADQQIGDTNVLESLKNSALNKVPLVGNYAIPPEYRSAKYKADQWLLANVRHESGASIRPDEIPAFYHNYFPMPGDDEKTMREKDARRALTVKGVYDSLGDAKPAGDRFIDERKARKVIGDIPEMSIRTSRKTGQRQIHLNGFWEDIP